jgi:sugar phosphate isomerase/epimerase
MRLGIFASVFARPDLDQILEAVRRQGLGCVQFGLECAGLESMPARIDPDPCDYIRARMQAAGLEMAAVSGTFNMIHPDPTRRQEGLRRLGVLAGACRRLNAPLITLCTGTRDPGHMWRHHPENATPGAWRDLLESMARALEIAEEHRVCLGVEPEVSNVVDSPARARALLDEMRSPFLKIVMDGANIFPAGTLGRMPEILREAFGLLGPDIALAHAKDLVRDGHAGDRAAGTGVLDYGLYLELLQSAGFEGALVLHGLKEAEVPAAVAFARGKMETLRQAPGA